MPYFTGFLAPQISKKIGFFRKTAVIIGIIAVIIGILADNNIPVREQFGAIFAKQHCASWDVNALWQKEPFKCIYVAKLNFDPPVLKNTHLIHKPGNHFRTIF